MRTESAYAIPCECGATVESHTPNAKCPKCGVTIEVQGWGDAEAIARHSEEAAIKSKLAK